MDRYGDREKLTLPKNVAAVIQYVQAHGWDPVSATSDFRLTGFDTIAGDMDHPFYSPDPEPHDDESTSQRGL